MMEETSSPLISTKRSRSSSSSHHRHPFTGTFTRSKSQIYLHCNRSGRTRSDSFRHSKHHQNLRLSQAELTHFKSLNKKSKIRGRDSAVQDFVDDDLSRILIKDLRTRRVFSSGLCIDGEETKGSVKGYCSKEQDVEDLRVEVTVFEGTERGCSKDGDDANEEECLQAKPDTETLDCRFDDGKKKEESLSQARDCVSQVPLIVSVQRNIEKKIGNNLDPKFVLGPRSRVKVFKAPGSLSFGRLLPHLLDMVEENSCTLKKVDSTNIEGQQILMDKSKTDSSFIDGLAGDPEMLSLGLPIIANGLSDVGDAKLTSVEQITDSPMPFGSENDPCMTGYSPTSLIDKGCSKRLVNEGNERFELNDSSKDGNLNEKNHDSSSSGENLHINKCSNDAKPADNSKDKTTDTKSFCNDKDIDHTFHNLSLTVEKHRLSCQSEIGQQSDDGMQIDFGGIKAFDIVHPLPMKGTRSNLEKKSNDGDADDDVSDKSDDSKEESMQMTPPDPEICGKPDAYENVNNSTEGALQTDDHSLQKPINGSINRNKMDFTVKRNLCLNPCSRLKVFKTPKSFSYRRLLPYLMDITKGTVRNGHFPKYEKSIEQNQLSALSASHLGEAPMEKFNAKSYDKEHDTAHSSPTKMALLMYTSQAPSSDQPNVMSTEQCNETPMSLDLQEEQESQLMKVISNKDKELEGASGSSSPIHGTSLLVAKSYHHVDSKSDSCDGLNLAPQNFCVDIESVRHANDAKPVEVSSISQCSLHHDVCDPLVIPSHCSPKGILKRNPRGCRGVCNCLNCASFRLHAKKAFEFSKNQMQDAEEMAFDLINELSQLRKLLNTFGSDAGHSISTNEVREACRKASEAEEIAKDRLSQMNYDLNIHCRIKCGQRPRVTFANNFKQRIIP